MRKIALGTGISLKSVFRIEKQELQLKPYNSKWFNFWRLTTSVYDWNDVDDSVSLVASHLWTGSEFCSRMTGYSPSNKSTVIRTTGSWSTAKIQCQCYGLGRNFHHRHDPFSIRRWGGKLTKTFTAVTYWWFLGPVAALADSNEDFNRIPLQPIEQKRRRSGAKLIFPTSPILRMASLLAGSQPYGLLLWSILEARACAKPSKNLKALKQSLQRWWDWLSAVELRWTAMNFRKRLTLCVKADGGQFEAY